MCPSLGREQHNRKTSHPSPLTLRREEDASTGAITAVATLLQLLHTQDQEAVHAASNTLKQLAGGAAEAQPGSNRAQEHLSQLSCPVLQVSMTLGALQQSGCKACPPARCSMGKMPPTGWQRE